MPSRLRKTLSEFNRFLRTPTLSRSVTALMAMALALLMFVNIATLVMIQRESEFNDVVSELQQTRRAARTLFISVLDAETGQRGFILTGRPEFLLPHEDAAAQKAERMANLRRLVAEYPELIPHLDRLEAAIDAKMHELNLTIELARTGRIGEAVQMVRAGEGRRQMQEIRAQVTAIDTMVEAELAVATRQSERAARATAAITGLAGLLILVLAGVAAWLVRRYLSELSAARDELDLVNDGLEDTVKERTAALSRANDEIQRFAYIVSHDLRAPLVNVMGYTSELEQAGRTIDGQLTRIEAAQPDLLEPDAVTAVREELPEAIGFIRASTAKMDRLINAILKLSREGRRPLAPEPLDMAAMVQGIADSLRHQIEAASAEVEIGQLPAIESDRLSMEQVFGNLIDNAVKYLDPARPGLIRIEGADLPDGMVEFRIIDNGRGVSERDHERVFELFRRSGRQDRPGEGLGLAFVRNSARRLGGEIDLESELGKGSTFRLKFPKRLKPTPAGDAV